MLICEVAFKVRKCIILLLVDSLLWYILNNSSATWHRWMTFTEGFINPPNFFIFIRVPTSKFVLVKLLKLSSQIYFFSNFRTINSAMYSKMSATIVCCVVVTST